MLSNEILNKIEEEIQKGFLIVFPTDSLYALGGSIRNEQAVQSVFTIKKRPYSVPLPVGVSNFKMLHEIAVITPLAKILSSHFFPGLLTLVLDQKNVSPLITSNGESIAVRIPNDAIALQIIEKTGPLTLTSANLHKTKTPSGVAEIKKMFPTDKISRFIDDGIRFGITSTIVDARGNKPRILRKGFIPEADILGVVDR